MTIPLPKPDSPFSTSVGIGTTNGVGLVVSFRRVMTTGPAAFVVFLMRNGPSALGRADCRGGRLFMKLRPPLCASQMIVRRG